MPSGLCLCYKAWNISSLALKEKTCSYQLQFTDEETGTENFRNLPRVTQLQREEPRFKSRLSTLNPPMLLLLNGAGCTMVQPARRARCHRRPGESERPGHGRSEGLNPQLDPHLPPFPGQSGAKLGLGVSQWLLRMI